MWLSPIPLPILISHVDSNADVDVEVDIDACSFFLSRVEGSSGFARNESRGKVRQTAYRKDLLFVMMVIRIGGGWNSRILNGDWILEDESNSVCWEVRI